MLTLTCCFLFFAYPWRVNSAIITRDCGNYDCNQEFIYDKTSSDNVKFICSTDSKCTSLIIYWAATSQLTVECWDNGACNNVKIYCGYWDPPSPYSLSDMDTSNNVDCELLCDIRGEFSFGDACTDVYLGCKGTGVDSCDLHGYAGDQILRATVECGIGNGMTDRCHLNCDEGCQDSSLLCHTGSKCSGEGSGYSINTATWSPTVSPTFAPTNMPTTNIPTTSIPTFVPTNMPTTNMPTTFAPTNMPTTNIPTTSVPTTNIPTTNMPTSKAPTTGVPTTGVPTTSMPTTDIPTSNMPTTATPTTTNPTTTNPTTTNPTTTNPTTNNPTTNNPTVDDNGKVNDITSTSIVSTNIQNAASNKDKSKATDLFSLDNIIMYIVVVIAVMLVILICMSVVYLYAKKKAENNNDTEKESDRMLRVKSASLEMMNVGPNLNVNQEILYSPNMNGHFVTAGGTLCDEHHMINTIINTLPAKANIFYVDDENEGTGDENDGDEEDLDDLYQEPHLKSQDMTTKGANIAIDEDPDTQITPNMNSNNEFASTSM